MKYYLILLFIILALGCNKGTVSKLNEGQSIILNLAIDSTVIEHVQYVFGNSDRIWGDLSGMKLIESRFYTIESLINGLASVKKEEHVKKLFWQSDIGTYKEKFHNTYLITPSRNFEIIHSIIVKYQGRRYSFIKFKDFEQGNHLLGIRGVIMVYDGDRYYLLNHTPKGLEDIFEWSVSVKSDLAKSLLRLPSQDRIVKQQSPRKYEDIIEKCKNHNGGFNLNKFNEIVSNLKNKKEFYDEVYMFHY